MNKNKKHLLSTLASAVVLSVSCGAVAQEGTLSETGDRNVGAEPICEALSDQVHTLDGHLPDKATVKCYSFKALRGQNVLLVNRAPAVGAFLLVEYFHDGQWKAGHPTSTTIISDLSPGDEVKVRIAYRQDRNYADTPYRLSFGSYPVMTDVTLTAPPVVNRVPVADTGWVVGLQTHGELTYQASFTDSTNTPLKGAIGNLRLYSNLGVEKPDVSHGITADDSGKASVSFKLDKCYGGEQISERNDRQGTHYWRSYYNVVRWYAYDEMIGTESEIEASSRMEAFAHICQQQLIRGRAERS
jgi:hypothetical protein